MKLITLGRSAIVATVLCSLNLGVSADVVTDWNLITVNATKTGGLNSNLGSRIDAIEAIAVYDAVNSIERFGTAYHYHSTVTTPASAQAAAAQAAHDVLVAYFPAQGPSNFLVVKMFKGFLSSDLFQPEVRSMPGILSRRWQTERVNRNWGSFNIKFFASDPVHDINEGHAAGRDVYPIFRTSCLPISITPGWRPSSTKPSTDDLPSVLHDYG